MSVSLFATEAKPTGSVLVKSSDNSKIRVVLDGRQFEPNDDAVIITGLNQGSHSVTVYKQRAGMFRNSSSRYDVIYNGSLNVKRRTEHQITISRNNKVSFTETRTAGRGNQYDNQYDYNNGQWGGNSNDNQWDDQYDGYGNGGVAAGMDSREFDQVLRAIDKEWLEGNKIKSATHIARNNALSVSQVKQLVQLFTFENNKLELAKQAYQNTVDKRNYYVISDLLTFGASKAELETYIRNYR